MPKDSPSQQDRSKKIAEVIGWLSTPPMSPELKQALDYLVESFKRHEKRRGSFSDLPCAPKHSPEPWRTVEDDYNPRREIAYGPVCIMDAGSDNLGWDNSNRILALKVLPTKEDAERIVACVNFCKGVESKDLSGNLGIFVQAKMNARRCFFVPEVEEAIAVLKG